MALTSLAAGVAGLLCLFLALRRDYPASVAALTALLVLGGTSLLVSLHSSSTTDAVLFAIAAFVLIATSAVGTPARVGLWLAVAVVPLLGPRVGGEALPSTLFTPDRGFLALYPVTYVAALGTIGLAATRHLVAIIALALLAIWAAMGVNLSAALALLAPGLAFVIDWARRRPVLAVAPLVLFAAVWNYWLMVQYAAGWVPKDAPVSFALMVRQQAEAHTDGRYIYPFAFPGNVWFAWREGVPLERYDTLSVAPRRDSFDVVFERGVERFLLDGWGPPGVNATGPFRWADGPAATLTFPLDPPASNVEVYLLATARGDDPGGAGLTVTLNGHVLGRLDMSRAAPTEERFVIPAASIRRVLRAGYNRLSLVPSGNLRIAVHRIRLAPVS